MYVARHTAAGPSFLASPSLSQGVEGCDQDVSIMLHKPAELASATGIAVLANCAQSLASSGCQWGASAPPPPEFAPAAGFELGGGTLSYDTQQPWAFARVVCHPLPLKSQRRQRRRVGYLLGKANNITRKLHTLRHCCCIGNTDHEELAGDACWIPGPFSSPHQPTDTYPHALNHVHVLNTQVDRSSFPPSYTSLLLCFPPVSSLLLSPPAR